jgi:5'-nucleotidase
MRRLDRVLLTNDDGVDAPGLAVLEQVAAQLAREVWVVAPAHDQSGTSHSISLHAPLRAARLADRRFAVVGTPGDCTVLAVRHLMRDGPPDLVLSGVNRGANLGIETVFSGTVGAAMTAMLLGLPAIALSQAFGDRDAVRWDTARAHAGAIVERLWPLVAGTPACLNVNFPDAAPEQAGPLTLTRQGVGLVQGIEVDTRTDLRGGVPLAALPPRAARQPAGRGERAGRRRAHHRDATALRADRRGRLRGAGAGARPGWARMSLGAGQWVQWVMEAIPGGVGAGLRSSRLKKQEPRRDTLPPDSTDPESTRSTE